MSAKKFKIVFQDHEEDRRLLAAAVKALEDAVLAARYEFTIEQDVTAKTTTLHWWRRGGVNAE